MSLCGESQSEVIRFVNEGAGFTDGRQSHVAGKAGDDLLLATGSTNGADSGMYVRLGPTAGEHSPKAGITTSVLAGRFGSSRPARPGRSRATTVACCVGSSRSKEQTCRGADANKSSRSHYSSTGNEAVVQHQTSDASVRQDMLAAADTQGIALSRGEETQEAIAAQQEDTAPFALASSLSLEIGPPSTEPVHPAIEVGNQRFRVKSNDSLSPTI